ncbi:hypothetical protein SCATT_42980 [Streptantibioticus cattleyicolor NRRL 8057 = DSM 46488]|uniref:Uncharacterized protein n=1 Tax=Streptantibioticus cattleyicolor (strain ATCC 35852 / DSM 46488 / JCM 4925 / NBRC 14057 / NRRL 8057) TaxID=1003195 RepID=G8WSW3_STREN|nr:hypothetical protein SCATT_42980 [Streptantibioticus cattleyicolor NRRL 8057 = DSM 46488]
MSGGFLGGGEYRPLTAGRAGAGGARATVPGGYRVGPRTL